VCASMRKQTLSESTTICNVRKHNEECANQCVCKTNWLYSELLRKCNIHMIRMGHVGSILMTRVWRWWSLTNLSVNTKLFAIQSVSMD
jgi:hypothetical protein